MLFIPVHEGALSCHLEFTAGITNSHSCTVMYMSVLYQINHADDKVRCIQ